jgi:uncharacterized protein YdiU (UPF0061 family)
MTNGKSASVKPAGFDVLSAVTCADELRPMGNAFRGLYIFGKYCAQLGNGQNDAVYATCAQRTCKNDE